MTVNPSGTTATFTTLDAHIDIPYDIWAHIASFLDNSTLDAHFALNKAFLYLYMCRRYRSVYFGEWANPQVFLAFKRLKDPSLAQYVESLSFFYEPFPIRLPATLPFTARRVKRVSWRISTSSRATWRSMDTRDTSISESDLLEIVSNLTNLNTLTIQSYCNPHFLRTVWRTFSSTLRSLTLNTWDIPGWDIPNTLCPNLAEFTLHSSCPCMNKPTEGIDDVNEHLGPFLNLHRDSLRSLTLVICDPCSIDVLHLFEVLIVFPTLETLSLTHLSSALSREELQDHDMKLKVCEAISSTAAFMTTRAPALKHFSITTPATHVFRFLLQALKSQDRTSPGQLQSLTVAVHEPDATLTRSWPTPEVYDAVVFPDFKSCVQFFLPTLRKLDISQTVALSYDQAARVIDIFSLQGNGSVLDALHLSISDLEARLFAYVSTTLPHLKRFEVGYVKLKSQALAVAQSHLGQLALPTQGFMNEMQAQGPFTQWGLEGLSIKPLQYWPWVSCKETIADAFPRVKTFNGASREEYLSSQNKCRI